MAGRTPGNVPPSILFPSLGSLNWTRNPANLGLRPLVGPNSMLTSKVEYKQMSIPTACNPFDHLYRHPVPAPLGTVTGFRFQSSGTSQVSGAQSKSQEDWSKNVSRIESMFQTGRRFRFVSIESGRALQLLWDTATQCLFLDGNGAIDLKPDIMCNSAWTVINKGHCRFQFHCNDHYLSVVNGQVTVINMTMAPEGVPDYCYAERTWELTTVEGKLYVQSAIIKDIFSPLTGYLAVMGNGQLIPAIDCGQQRAAQFGVQLLAPLEQFQPPVAHQWSM